MAWQTPKTDWSAADGVRDSDLNRIEGNIQDLYDKAALMADITIYVDASGSDTAGNGTRNSPYKTIGYALNTVPRNLNGKDAIIYVATGVYPENVIIKGYNDGKVVLTGYYGDAATFNSLEIDSSICEIRSLVVSTTTGGITVTNGGTLLSTGRISAAGSPNGLRVMNGSTCRIYAMLTVDGSGTAAVHVNGASIVYILQLSGSNNENAILAEEGSIVSYGSANISVNIAGYITRTGGRIYTGAQTSTPNY